MNFVVAGAKRLFNPSGFSNKLSDRMADVSLAAKDFKAYTTRLILKKQEDMIQLQGWSTLVQAEMSQQFNEMGHDIRKLTNSVERDVIYDNVKSAVLEALQPFLQTYMQSKFGSISVTCL
jgi:hypothetical protein